MKSSHVKNPDCTFCDAAGNHHEKPEALCPCVRRITVKGAPWKDQPLRPWQALAMLGMLLAVACSGCFCGMGGGDDQSGPCGGEIDKGGSDEGACLMSSRPMSVNDPTAGVETPTVTPHGTPGVTTWGYKVVARTIAGGMVTSVEGTTNTGNAVLNSTNFNEIDWVNVHADTAYAYDVYRTTGPLQVGLIGTVLVDSGLTTFNDIGQTIGGDPPPAVNTTGIGDPCSVADMTNLTIAISGTFTFGGSNGIIIEGSIDGTNWYTIVAKQTAVGIFQYTTFLSYVRTNVTGAPTGGIPEATVGGNINPGGTY